MSQAPTTNNRIDALFDRINYERQSKMAPGDFKLSNMLRFLESLRNVHLDCPVVHVAGTKGKGSVSAFVGAILQSAGLKTGIYSSPHLERVNQRIVFNGNEITDRELVEVLSILEPHIMALDQSADEAQTKKLTFFEVITAAAFQYFSNHNADAVVLEVGMGGRLDSTNVCYPEICVITSISLDHTKQLGATVEQIAAEKAGIIKPGVPVVCGVLEPGPRDVIANVADEKKCEFIQLNDDFTFGSQGLFDFSMKTAKKPIEFFDIECGMAGVHQRHNASLAIATCQVLKSSGWQINECDIRRGIESAFLPGRCETVTQHPLTILDIAHNAASTQALANTLQSRRLRFTDAEKKYLIFASSREKDIPAMLESLIQIFDEIVITQYQDNPRGRPADEVFEIALKIAQQQPIPPKIVIEKDPLRSWQLVDEKSTVQDAICVTGSAFLVAELRPIVVKNAI